MITFDLWLTTLKKNDTSPMTYMKFFNFTQQLYIKSTPYHVDASYCPNLDCSVSAIVSPNFMSFTNYINICGSINAEVFAILDCMTCIVNTQSPGDYVIYNDSLEAIKRIYTMAQSLEATKPTPILAKYQIVIVWIPSHVGIVGNEVADEYARYGLQIMRGQTTNDHY